MSNKVSRISSHAVETRSRDLVRSKIDNTDNALFREITERDYGIDAVVELFEDGRVTGKFALIQIKGTDKKIVPLKRSNEVSCEITSSNASYATQNNIPVILIYASLNENGNFYFTNLQGIITDEHRQKINNGQEKITVRIPLENSTQEDIQPFFDIINSFYNKK